MPRVFFVFRIASKTSTNLTSRWWQLCIPYILWNLAKARFIWFREGFHTFSAASISRLKLYCLFFSFSKLRFFSRFILRILSSAYKIFFRASATSTSLASLLPNLRSSLTFWYNTNTSFFWSICVFAYFATLFNYSASTYLYLILLSGPSVVYFFRSPYLIYSPYFGGDLYDRGEF